jgi:uncharacterized coiled-coil protein SlyX
VYKKVQDVKESLAITITGARDAIATLENQISALHDKHDEYANQWSIANSQVRSKMQSRITILEEKCRLAKPTINVFNTVIAETDIKAEFAALQTQVQHLMKQNAEQACELAALKTQPSVQVFAAVAEGIVPGLSPEEKAARLSHAAGVQAAMTAGDKTPIGTTALTKGKGKGKPDAGAVY